MFPDGIRPLNSARKTAFEIPKTLIFAKSDSHAEDIIDIVRDEFAAENKFCKKITYRSEEDPKSVLSQFRNDYYPRIAVTVDMIATGTDIRPLEVLVFMRDVKSELLRADQGVAPYLYTGTVEGYRHAIGQNSPRIIL